MASGKSVNPLTGLTYNQEAFCEEYIRNGYNATEAYMTVYNCQYNTANSSGPKQLKNPLVTQHIKNLQKRALDEKCVTAERIALKLADMAFAEPDDENYGPATQLKALDLLQKQFGLQQQKIKADVEAEQTITVTIEGD